ncbi:Stf0 family sulfotransferase [Albidovulum sp.]|uniref:Stf0 family sulfotransferase n=1 Tax=Albidovulum sp. TaxID=1872424 RepID=UPI0035291867
MRSYVICATPRTGSTLLCDLLTATGSAGAPDSFFMADPDPAWARAWGLPRRGTLSPADHARATLAAAIRAGSGRSGFFGLRLMHRDLPALAALIEIAHPGRGSDRARFEAAFGEVLYIRLARQDRLAQAVSLVKAVQTGLWHVAPDGREIERLAPPRPPVYDAEAIGRTLARLEAEDAGWLGWFAAAGVTPLRIGYEALAANPAAEIGRICDALGLAAPAPGTLRPGVAPLADATNSAWIARFRAETRG